jgi:lysophospholipase L1-like esterase
LGDSYSSGVGTDNYYSDGTSCDRSPQGYPALWSAAHGTASFDLAACSGAKTSDVLSGQLGGLSASTNLVTITIGGNDAGFTTVMENCIIDSDSSCQSQVSSAETYIHNTLPGLLDNVYANIRSHAPNAQVVVLGYPRFYQVPGSCVVGISDTKRTAIDGGSVRPPSTAASRSPTCAAPSAHTRSARRARSGSTAPTGRTSPTRTTRSRLATPAPTCRCSTP